MVSAAAVPLAPPPAAPEDAAAWLRRQMADPHPSRRLSLSERARRHRADSREAARHLRLHMIAQLDRIIESDDGECLREKLRLDPQRWADVVHAVQVLLFPEEFEADPRVERRAKGILRDRPNCGLSVQQFRGAIRKIMGHGKTATVHAGGGRDKRGDY